MKKLLAIALVAFMSAFTLNATAQTATDKPVKVKKVLTDEEKAAKAAAKQAKKDAKAATTAAPATGDAAAKAAAKQAKKDAKVATQAAMTPEQQTAAQAEKDAKKAARQAKKEAKTAGTVVPSTAPVVSTTPAVVPTATKRAADRDNTIKNSPVKASPAVERQAAGEDKAIGKDDKGRTVFEGPRGGHYYINANGNKSYISKDKQ